MTEFRLEILGSGGAFGTPRPGCQCILCQGAREHGIPWLRTGPSVFVHGPNILIDTPEESMRQLDRSSVGEIAAAFYSHWHPDHTAGRRVFEMRNWDTNGLPPENLCTPVYLPPKVAEDFEEQLGLAENFRYLANLGLVDLHRFDAPLTFGGWRVTPVLLDIGYVYGYLFEEEINDGSTPRRALICMDELVGWAPPAFLQGVDFLYLPAGVFEFHPLSGERLIPLGHPVLQSEATFLQTLEIIEQIQPKRIVFGHLEEPFSVTPAEYEQLAANLRAQRGWDVTFACDTLVLEL
ncbi:MAG: hypothetical protein KDD92_03695 [Caldilineaceae bacterium]|nr:hypothetical protein [Caldilineaceae bacterium]